MKKEHQNKIYKFLNLNRIYFQKYQSMNLNNLDTIFFIKVVIINLKLLLLNLDNTRIIQNFNLTKQLVQLKNHKILLFMKIINNYKALYYLIYNIIGFSKKKGLNFNSSGFTIKKGLNFNLRIIKKFNIKYVIILKFTNKSSNCLRKTINLNR